MPEKAQWGHKLGKGGSNGVLYVTLTVNKLRRIAM